MSTESIITLDQVSYQYPEGEAKVFNNLSLSIPSGITSLIGQNGVGKSTFLLLAGARLYPQEGEISILGRKSTELTDETEKNKLVSFVYQNMEFETENPLGDLLPFVYQAGNPKVDYQSMLEDLKDNLDLSNSLHKKTQEMSKGELQRSVIAFSLLYGSPIILMDEPIFALEDKQKYKTLSFLRDFSQLHKVSVLYSLHELELSKEYSQNLMFFYKDQRVALGPTKDLFTRENIEEVYQIPFTMLHKKEHLFRTQLQKNELSPEMEEILKKDHSN